MARCAARLSSRPENLVSVLSSVPALLANRTKVTWSRDITILSSPESGRHDIEEVMEEAEGQLDRQTDRVTEKSLLCGVCGLVLIDRALRAGQEVYDISEKSVSLTLQAAHTKLKSWKRTAMSSRALLYVSCLFKINFIYGNLIRLKTFYSHCLEIFMRALIHELFSGGRTAR